MAMACPYKKRIIQELKETINEKENQTKDKNYAQVAAKHVINETKQTQILRIHTNTELKTAIVPSHTRAHS